MLLDASVVIDTPAEWIGITIILMLLVIAIFLVKSKVSSRIDVFLYDHRGPSDDPRTVEDVSDEKEKD